jgi:hypothetical protein
VSTLSGSVLCMSRDTKKVIIYSFTVGYLLQLELFHLLRVLFIQILLNVLTNGIKFYITSKSLLPAREQGVIGISISQIYLNSGSKCTVKMNNMMMDKSKSGIVPRKKNEHNKNIG